MKIRKIPYISIIVAMVQSNRVIGADGKTPWHIKEYLVRFKKITTGQTGHPIIMGRKTAEEIGAIKNHYQKGQTLSLQEARRNFRDSLRLGSK